LKDFSSRVTSTFRSAIVVLANRILRILKCLCLVLVYFLVAYAVGDKSGVTMLELSSWDE
jgi:hypothetical protein